MNAQETKVTDYAASHGQPVIRMDIVQVMGRSIEDVKLMGLLPESFYANGDDFNLYVRWDVSYGAVYVTRSDTDEVLITVGLARKGKIAAFGELMQALANRYGVPVYVELDYGISGAQASKLVGRWAPQVANISIPTDDDECLCDEIFDPTNPSTWNEANLPAGWSWVECADSLGEYHLFTPEGTDHTRAMIDLRDAQAAQRLADATAMLSGIVARDASDVIATNAPVIEGYEWKRHVNPGESVWAGSTYQLIAAGSVCQVAATVKHRGHGLWAAQTCYWGNAGLTKDFWGGESLADAFANVVAHQEFLSRARAAGLSGTDIARIMDWRTWQAPTALPIRTPGAAWDLIESEIWAGMDLVEPMRRTRLSRRGKKSLEKAFREDCCGRADHERWCRTWRPITKRHAARMGIDRKDAVLLRPKFADLLAARVGK